MRVGRDPAAAFVTTSLPRPKARLGAKARVVGRNPPDREPRFRCMVVAVRRRANGAVPKRLPLDHMAVKQRALIPAVPAGVTAEPSALPKRA